MRYYLKETGFDSWNDCLDDFLEVKSKAPQITWHNYYIAKKDFVNKSAEEKQIQKITNKQKKARDSKI